MRIGYHRDLLGLTRDLQNLSVARPRSAQEHGPHFLLSARVLVRVVLSDQTSDDGVCFLARFRVEADTVLETMECGQGPLVATSLKYATVPEL